MISIVVRSFNRVESLCDLLEALLHQDHDDFELVVVEQSTSVTSEAAARLARLALDPRIVLLRRRPLGGAMARNVGVEASRGDPILFIDDDDLPVGRDWISAHARAYDDPRCLGVSGRHVHNDDVEHRYKPLLARITGTLGFDPILKTSLTYVQHDRRVIPVHAVHGTNGSIRRAAWERFGGWDADTRIEDEVSFCYRALAGKRPEEYFAYDPRPVILRNRDVAGGLDKRRMRAGVYLGHYLDFIHRIIGRYHRARVIGLYPLYVLAAWILSVGWIHQSSRVHRSWLAKGAASIALLVTLPVHVGRALIRLAKAQPATNSVISTPIRAPAGSDSARVAAESTTAQPAARPSVRA